MYPLNNKYSIKPKQRAIKLLILIPVVFSALTVAAQNINRPNKMGPLGTEVNTFTGNLFIARNDIFVPGRGFNFAVSFYYNSYDQDRNIGFGNGWNMTYCVKYQTDTANGKIISWGDGREDTYAALPGGGYKTPTGFYNTLTQYQPNKYLLSELDGTKFYFDNNVHKKITRLEEPGGNYINFNYADSLLTSIVNTAGQAISFTYDGNGKLATIVDAIAPPARTYFYTYDGNGNLTEVKDPLNGKNKYTYLVNGPMKTIADKNDNTVDIIYYNDFSISELIGCNKRVSFSYDTTTNITVVTDHLATGNQVTSFKYQKFENLAWVASISGNCCGYNLLFEFDNYGNKIKETDANGQVYNYTYDAKGNLLSTKDPLNQTTSYTYSPDFNQVTSCTDPKGNVYTMTYNLKGDLTQLTEPGNNTYLASYNAHGDIISSIDPKGNIYTYSYDTYGNPASVTGPNGYFATLVMDARGNLLSLTDARNNTHTAQYDILNRLKKITDPLNNAAQINYDAESNVTSFINKNNETSVFDYDASNRIVKIKDPSGHQTEMTYDGMDNLTSIKNALGNTVNFLYDTRNRLSRKKDALNNNNIYNYDANGNVTSKTKPNGETISYTYDNINRITGISDINGPIATLTYDKNSNILTYTNGTGALIAAVYDSLNRLTKITDPLGFTNVFAYDKNNNVISIIDKNGFTKTYLYDSTNRIKSFTDNNSFLITVTYDAMGNVVQEKDQKNNITLYTYDSLNRTKSLTYPDGKFIQYGYDKKGNLTSKKLTNGTSIIYQYDSLNRIITKTLPDGNVYNYGYDAIGRVITATNNTGTVAITYDALNRISSETFDGRTTRYNYDIAGRTQTTIYPDSTFITKSFDTRNRLTSISKNNTNIVNYQYNNTNQLISKNFANGVSTGLQYDFANRLSSISTASGSIQNTTFTYDKERNKTAINRLDNPSWSEQFTYDNGYRLTNYKRGIAGSPTVQNTYSFDAVGNRTTANLNGSTTTYTTNNLNQLTNSNNGSQNINFTYDNNGNLTFDGSFYKTYDPEGRLIKDSSSPSNVLTYKYDAFNRRVQKNLNNNSYKYTFSGLAEIEERNGVTNNLLGRTVFTNFLSPVLNEKNNNSYYYHQNELNSVEAITNSAGSLTERYQYDVYGKPTIYDASNNIISSSIAGNRFGFTGQGYDSANGSYHFHYRNYSPLTGTFNQRDLIGYADGMGAYQYVHNNPANGIDILGLECEPKAEEHTEKEEVEEKEEEEEATEKYLFFLRVLKEGGPAALKRLNLLKNGKEFIKDLAEGVGKTAGKVGNALLGPIETGLDADDFGKNFENRSAVQNTERGANLALDVSEATLATAVGVNTLSTMGGGELIVAVPEIAIPVIAGVGGYKIANGASKLIDGKSLAEREWLVTPGKITGEVLSNFPSQDFTINYNAEWERTEDGMSSRRTKKYTDARRRALEGHTLIFPPATDCPQNNPHGSQKKKIIVTIWGFHLEIVAAKDPNEIIGPDGVITKRWVSVKDRLPYTILYENDKSASAPAKFIRVTSPIEPKQDAATFQLGSFGFNNQTFAVPPSTASYYQRLDCRDSLGLYVDITAGYDQINNQAFWEFQSIDPVTLLPPADPLKGFLLLQDSSKGNFGHGFVNFSIKPKQTAITLDTIGARASIVFDSNDTIPTNIAKNTIDAFAPVSHMNIVSGSSNNPVALSWGGVDDAGGCGLKYYTLYVSSDGINFNIVRSGITRTDTSFTGAVNSTYSFFVLATDSVGNTEVLRPGEIRSIYIGSALPVTWLYFRGMNQDKDNLLDWATASEQNSKEFRVERSLNGIAFNDIGTVAAAGNSTSVTTYQYTDHNIDRLNSNVLYYRLKQIDIDNHFKYSSIVRLTYNQEERLKSLVYPNPTQGLITISIGDKKLIGTIASLYDLNGKHLEDIKITSDSQTLDLGKYVNGVYFIRLINKEVLKVIKQ
jgi:RHS repeat-associated protein